MFIVQVCHQAADVTEGRGRGTGAKDEAWDQGDGAAGATVIRMGRRAHL